MLFFHLLMPILGILNQSIDQQFQPSTMKFEIQQDDHMQEEALQILVVDYQMNM